VRVLEPEMRIRRVAAPDIVGIVEDPAERARERSGVAAVAHSEPVGEPRPVPQCRAAQRDRAQEEREREQPQRQEQQRDLVRVVERSRPHLERACSDRVHNRVERHLELGDATELVGEHGLELAVGQRLHQSSRHHEPRRVGRSTDGEAVRCVVDNRRDLRRADAGRECQGLEETFHAWDRLGRQRRWRGGGRVLSRPRAHEAQRLRLGVEQRPSREHDRADGAEHEPDSGSPLRELPTETEPGAERVRRGAEDPGDREDDRGDREREDDDAHDRDDPAAAARGSDELLVHNQIVARLRPRSVAPVDAGTPERRIDGLDGDIVVHRDEWGIPHVRATSVHDAFFGQGFVQAVDRLGQLEYDRRRARGTWAELAGPAAVAFDVFARRCDLAGAAALEADSLDGHARGVLDAYADGVNAYLELERPLPPDLAFAEVVPKPWTAADCCAVFLVRHVVFANWQKKLWRGRMIAAMGVDAVVQLEQADDRAVPLVVPPSGLVPPPPCDPAELAPVLAAMAGVVEATGGSNSWALHGSRTASGLPLLAGDPHRLLEVPSVYYQCHLACPDFDAVGLAFVGVPGFAHFGHTARVAWCVTNANGDYQDLYVESPADTTHARRETVQVRDADDVIIECHTTARGPVVFGDPERGSVLSLRSTALVVPSTGLAVVLPMLRARDVDELDDAMRAWVDPVNNFVSVDVDGNISYRTVGRVPIRAEANSWGPVPGADPRFEWQGIIPHDELPRLRNPDEGLIVTANQRIVEGQYPYRLGLDYARPDRALRLHARLDDLLDATVADMASVHCDVRSVAGAIWMERLARLEPADEWERAAVVRLRAWDAEMDADSAAAAVYVATRDAVCRRLAHHPALAAVRAPAPDEPTGTFQPLELRMWALSTGLLLRGDRTLLDPGRSWDDVLGEALADGVAVLRTVLGDDLDTWRWGSLHLAGPQHPLGAARPEWASRLDPPTVEMGGEWDTVMCAAHPAGHGFGVTSTSVARYVFDPADWDRSAWIVPLGASGDAASPHFADQQAAWARGELVPMRYSWDGIEAAATETLRLVPS